MAFKPGQSGNPKGRPPGVPNKITRTVKSEFERVFEVLTTPGEDGKPHPYSLEEIAKKNPLEFFKLAKALIPTKIDANVEGLIVNLATGVPKTQDEPEGSDPSDIA